MLIIMIFIFSNYTSMVIDGIPKESITDRDVIFEEQDDSPKVK